MYGPYIKSENNKTKIMYSILISLIPFIIYKLYLTNFKSIISLLIISIFSIITSIAFDMFKDYKNYKFKFINYLYIIIIGSITYLFIPYKTPIILTILSIVLGIIINKFLKNINSIFVSGLLVYGYFALTNGEIINLKINILLLIILAILSLFYLILNKSIKFRISLIFILIGLLSMFIKTDYTNLWLLIVLGIYVVPEFYSTPTTVVASIIYSLIMSIVFIFLPIHYFVIFGIIMNILNKQLDLNIAYYLAKNN